MMTGYRTILADPPWMEHGSGRIKRGADRHYPLLAEEQIVEVLQRVPMAEDAFLFLWTTNNHLPSALSVMQRAGFAYITNMVWVKDRVGLGQYFRGQHELLLLGRKGHPGYKRQVTPGRSVCTTPSVLFAPRREHSRKPDEVYVIAETIGFAPRIEVFARERREGWDVFGNETPCTFQSVLKSVIKGGDSHVRLL